MLPAEEVLGAVGITEMVVRPGDTSVAIGIGDLPIIAPSLLINLMEHAAILSLDLYLEPGETTIPISVEFISLSPAGIGASLRATSRVIEIDEFGQIEHREVTIEHTEEIRFLNEGTDPNDPFGRGNNGQGQ